MVDTLSSCPRPTVLLNSRYRYLLGLVWIVFLVRGLFYAALFPLWEGYDEWSHFAYVQRMADRGGLPLASRDRISREVRESLRLAPTAWRREEFPPLAVTHDAYWGLPAEERQQREQRLRDLPREWARQEAQDGPGLYEAQQPPLYYWLLSWPLRVFSEASLPDRVFLLRWLSVLLASAVIPLGFLAARRVFQQNSLALAAVALIAAMPELMVSTSRVANDGLATALYSLLIFASLWSPPAWWLGIVLGLGLLTKAYFLPGAAALCVIFAWNLWRRPAQRKESFLQGVLAAATALAIAGWWFWRNQLVTGSWSAMNQSVALAHTPGLEMVRRIPELKWRSALDFILVSYIWLGNWSFLQVRAWMYHLFEYVFYMAMVGTIVLLCRRRTPPLPGTDHLFVLLAFYGFFWVGMAYHTLITFMTSGISATVGWYLYAVVVVGVILGTAGLFALFPARWRTWILPIGTLGFALLDLYATNFILIPYYTGVIAHRANGALAAFHFDRLGEVGFQTVLLRLLINKPDWLSAPVMIVLWILFLAATALLPVLVFWLRRFDGSLPGEGSRQ